MFIPTLFHCLGIPSTRFNLSCSTLMLSYYLRKIKLFSLLDLSYDINALISPVLRYKYPLHSFPPDFPPFSYNKVLNFYIKSFQFLSSLSWIHSVRFALIPFEWNALSCVIFTLIFSFYFLASYWLIIHWYLSNSLNLDYQTPLSPKCTHHSVADPSQSHY